MSETDRREDCAEYVLGTLPPDERAAFERDAKNDAALREEITRWEEWFSGLNDAVAEVPPSPEVWAAIARRTEAAVLATPAPDVVARLRRSRGRWRAGALAFGAVAAGLALLVVRPAVLPPSASYLAVVDRGGALPALIVHVDLANNTVAVRSLAAEAPTDRSLELWYIGGNNPPRSMGLVGQRNVLPADARAGDLAGATLAVSVEPRGGSPTGAPTGEVVYSGKLIRDE